MEMSGIFPVKLLCEMMGIPRSSFYNWREHLSNPSRRAQTLVRYILLFQEYHLKYPSHGYRWLNAKIRLDTGLIMSDPYAYKCCKATGIKSEARHCKYKKPGKLYRVFPNLLMSEMNIDGPLQCIVSDMTAFYVKGIYYELTLYMDLWNNEIVSYSLSSKRGDRMTYISGLNDLLALRRSTRNTKRCCIRIKVLCTPQKASTNFCPCTALCIPCPVRGHRRTMQRWRRSMVGSRLNCLWIFM